MLLVAGHNQMGNVIHTITGPETSFFSDIHGACVMDVTELFNSLKSDEPVFLSLTRTDSERQCFASLLSSGVKVHASFFKSDNANAGANQVVTAPVSQARPVEQPSETGVCTYCAGKKQLLPVPGVKICAECAQIELGVRQAREIDTVIKDALSKDSP